MNRQEIANMLEQELSGDRALESAAHLTQFYRSPGGVRIPQGYGLRGGPLPG